MPVRRFEIGRRGLRARAANDNCIIETVPSSIVLPERIVQLLRYVIGAQRVLQRQIEKIFWLRDLGETVLATGAIPAAASPVNIHGDMLGQLVHEFLTAASSEAIAYEPDNRLRLALNYF